MLYELREWSICLACWLTVYLDYKILMILVKEYLYDKDVYEAVLLKSLLRNPSTELFVILSP